MLQCIVVAHHQTSLFIKEVWIAYATTAGGWPTSSGQTKFAVHCMQYCCHKPGVKASKFLVKTYAGMQAHPNVHVVENVSAAGPKPMPGGPNAGQALELSQVSCHP